jgi:hypothetical protein
VAGSIAGRCARRSCVLDRDDGHTVARLVEDVDEQNPAPGSEEEPEPLPPACELRSESRELAERLERRAYTLAGVGRQRVREDESIEVLGRSACEFDLRHVLQLVKRNGVAGGNLLGPELSAFEGAIDPVEQRRNVRRVRVEVIDGGAE